MRARRCGRDEITSFNVEPRWFHTSSAGVTLHPILRERESRNVADNISLWVFSGGRAVILHIVGKNEWVEAVARGSYAPPGLAAEGFVHCSTLAQVIATANRFYRGQNGLVVLCIDEERLRVELRYEASAGTRGEGAGETFPHLYGALNVDAVVQVVELPCEVNGSFRLPEGLRRLGV
jgi:uncharacterized protein (DUF952 family)